MGKAPMLFSIALECLQGNPQPQSLWSFQRYFDMLMFSIKSACETVKTKGTIVNVAIWEKEIPFNPNLITFKESVYKSVLGYDRKDYQAVIDNMRTGEFNFPRYRPTYLIDESFRRY
jgi:threonine dehydrogenase-like Zn-dependent dehydrogenase